MENLTTLQRARLRWRARRGLLENDLIITRFLDQYEMSLTDEDVHGLSMLLELGDNELLDILLGRSEPEGDCNTPVIQRLVKQLREA